MYFPFKDTFALLAIFERQDKYQDKIFGGQTHFFSFMTQKIDILRLYY